MKNWWHWNGPSILALVAFFGITVIAGFLITGFIDPPAHNNGTVTVSTVAVPVRESQGIGTGARNRNTLVNCEDNPITPCITWDESEWRLVTDYKPYTYITLFRCPTEDSDNCYWDARKRGNHKGNSFVTVMVNGKQHVYFY